MGDDETIGAIGAHPRRTRGCSAPTGGSVRRLSLPRSLLLAGLLALIGVVQTSRLVGLPAVAAAADGDVVLLGLDDGAGEDASDASGNSNDGMLQGGAVYVSETADGSKSSVAFDGTDGRIDLGTVDVEGPELTVAAWFNADDFPGPSRDPRLISKATGTADADHVFMLSTVADGSRTVLRGRVRVGGSTTTVIAAEGALSTSMWHHAALTHDGSIMRLYLDGTEVGRADLEGAVDIDPAVRVAVGAQPPGAGERFFDGMIDDVRILSRAMSADEIRRMAGAPSSGDASRAGEAGTADPVPVADEPVPTSDRPVRANGAVSATRTAGDLAALYTFEEGEGDVVADVSGADPPLDLVVEEPSSTSWVAGTLSVDAATTIASRGPATKIVEAARRSGALTLEAWIAPERVDQDGPAQILTVSEPAGPSNVGLGQGLWGSQPSDLYGVRLRTTATNDDGQPELTTPSGSLASALTHVVYTRDATGTAVIYIDGLEQSRSEVAGDLGNWDPGARLILGSDAQGERPWLGRFHLVAFYSRALTAEEVGQNMTAGPEGASPTGSVAPPPAVSTPSGDIPFTRVEIDPRPPEQAHVKALGDIDGDGFLDAAAGGAREGDGLYWYEYPEWTKHEIAPPGTGFTTDMKIVDVDGDSDQDIVVPTGFHRGETLWWFENPSERGDPRTDPWIEHEIGDAPAHDVEVDDIDGNGLVDAVVRNDALTAFLQTAPDRWEPIGLGSFPVEGTDLGDIDRDGDVDIVVGGQWLENPMPARTVDQEWIAHTIAAGWPGHAAATIADVDADGRLDVALAPSELASGRLSWFEAPPEPADVDSWVEHVVDADVEFLHQFRAVDVDLDGDADLVTAEMHQAPAPQNVSVYRNDGGGTAWSEQVIATTGSHNIQVGDVDDDDDIDILGVNWHGLTPLELWRNELDQGADGAILDRWERHEIAGDLPERSVFVDDVDIDGDGFLDVVVGGWWYENTGAIEAGWDRHTIGAPMNQMTAVHDFDGDGDADVLGTQGVGSDPNSSFAWAENDGTGTFTVHTNVDAGVGDFLQGATVARFDGPLQIVLSWHDESVGLQSLTVPDDPAGERWTWEQLSETSLGEGVDHGDIDGDGDLDLTLGTTWMRNEGGSWSEFTIHTPGQGVADRVQLVDVDQDGDLDALVGYGHDPEGKLAWYENPDDPTEAWPEHLLANVVNPQSLDHADLDGDGDLDVVAGEHRLAGEQPEAATLFVMENVDGAGDRWRRHDIHVGDEHHDGAQLSDFDDDGDLDVVSIGWTHPRLLIYENTGVEP